MGWGGGVGGGGWGILGVCGVCGFVGLCIAEWRRWVVVPASPLTEHTACCRRLYGPVEVQGGGGGCPWAVPGVGSRCGFAGGCQRGPHRGPTASRDRGQDGPTRQVPAWCAQPSRPTPHPPRSPLLSRISTVTRAVTSRNSTPRGFGMSSAGPLSPPALRLPRASCVLPPARPPPHAPTSPCFPGAAW